MRLTGGERGVRRVAKAGDWAYGYAVTRWRNGFIDELCFDTGDYFYGQRSEAAADILAEMLAMPAARFVRRFRIGDLWAGDGEGPQLGYAVEAIAAAPCADVVRSIRCVGRDHQVSGVGCDASALWAGCPRLAQVVLWGNDIDVGEVHAPNLRQLTVRSGGLDGSVVRAIGAGTLPALDAFELWFGSEGYSSIDDSTGCPAVTRLGLRKLRREADPSRPIYLAPERHSGRDGTEPERGFVSMVPVADGVVAFWLDGRATLSDGAMALRTATISDHVGPSTVVDDRVCDCCGTGATVLTDGDVVVVWRDRSEAEHRDIRAVRVDGSPAVDVGADRWQIEGCPVNGPRVVGIGAQEVIAAWTTGAGDALSVRASLSMDGGRTFGPSMSLAPEAGEPAPLGRVDLVAAGDGTVLVSWLASEGAEAEIRLRRMAVVDKVLYAGEPRVLGRASNARSTGFPRIGIQAGAVVASWTGEKGLLAASLPTAAIPSAQRALTRVP